ncbi:MAG: AAA family ATPase [Syntrophales bacterium]|nr:AAA family ATPase [Syntrophales bacterium]
MYIFEVKISNIMSFDDITLSIENSKSPCFWNVILGDNSTGKSSVLRCIAIGLSDQNTAATLIKSWGADLLRDNNKPGKIIVTLGKEGSGPLFTITTRIIPKYSMELVQPKIIRPKEYEAYFWNELFICGYGIQRSGGGSEISHKYSPLEAVMTLFDYYYPIQNIELILHRISRERPDRENKILTLIKEVLMLDEDQSIILTPKGLKFIFDGREVFLDYIGDGYSGTATWLIDFLGWQLYADRMSKDQQLSDLVGIILLDELELALHPKLQRNIVRNLKEHFPKVQFIVTTHSPIIAAGAADFQDARLFPFRLDKDKTILIEDIPSLRGRSVDQVLSSMVFGMYITLSPGSVSDIDRFSELMSKSRDQNEETEFQKLRKILEDAMPIGTTEAERLVEKAILDALEKLLNEKPSKDLELIMKDKLNKLDKY